MSGYQVKNPREATPGGPHWSAESRMVTLLRIRPLSLLKYIEVGSIQDAQ
ncbi:MAG TPA: hypothetical protein VF784_02305 [Anaerolineales bacterium]